MKSKKPNTHLQRMYASDFGLMTDLYQLTMAYGYWKTGLYRRRAVFNLFYRRPPFGGSFVMAAGLELAVDFLQGFRFSAADVQYLGGLSSASGRPLFDEAFLNYLQRMKLDLSIKAMPEGSIAFPHQPLLRVEGPLVQCQLVETGLLALVNFSSLIATKSARIVTAAQGDSVLEFGMRRSQGLDGAMTAVRSAYIGGCHATSNVMAGRIYGIPVKGTHAHSWVMCFEDELAAFEAYAQAMPDNCIFLVDTYDTIEGVRHAITVGQRLRERGHEMNGIRLDSGDLGALSKAARELLDEAGFPDAAIVASNDLDEYRIRKLKEAGAAISVWGVGTRLATAYGDPALGGVYKLSAITNEAGEWEDRMKQSEEIEKASNPGLLQVWRSEQSGQPAGDLLFDERDGLEAGQLWDAQTAVYTHLPSGDGQTLLQPILERGEVVYDFPPLTSVRAYGQKEWQRFSALGEAAYLHGPSRSLHERKRSGMLAGKDAVTDC